MAKQQDFRRDLGKDIKVESNAKPDALLQEAADLRAKAHITTIKSRIDTFQKAMETAVEAGTGYLKAKQAKEILAEIDKTEDLGASALKSQEELRKITSAEGQYATGERILEAVRNEAGTPPIQKGGGGLNTSNKIAYEQKATEIINEVIGSVEREKAKLLQGIQNRQQTITNIASITKRYSAMVPGLADEFRKVAASKTGISNVDVYNVYNALTQETSRERAAKESAQLRKEYLSALQSHFGIPAEKLTEEHERLYAVRKGREAELARQEQAMKEQNFTLAQNDSNALLLLDLQFAVSDAYINDHAARLMDSNRDMDFSGFKKQQAAYSRALNEQHSRLMSYVDSLETGANASGTKITAERAKFLRERIETTINNHSKWFEKEENYNAFKALTEEYKGKEEQLLSVMSLKSPLIALFGRTGVLPEVAKNFFLKWKGGQYDEGSKAQFIHDYGVQLWNDFESMVTDPDPTKIALLNRMVGASGRPDPEVIQQVAPGIGRIGMKETVETWRKHQDPNYQMTEGDGKVSAMGMNLLRSSSPTGDPATWGAFETALKSGSIARSLAAMSPEDQETTRREVIEPLDAKIKQDLTATIEKGIEALTAEVGLDLVWDGEKFSYAGATGGVTNWLGIKQGLTAGKGPQAYLDAMNNYVRLSNLYAEQLGTNKVDFPQLWTALNKQASELAAKQIEILDRQILKEAAANELNSSRIPQSERDTMMTTEYGPVAKALVERKKELERQKKIYDSRTGAGSTEGNKPKKKGSGASGDFSGSPDWGPSENPPASDKGAPRRDFFHSPSAGVSAGSPPEGESFNQTAPGWTPAVRRQSDMAPEVLEDTTERDKRSAYQILRDTIKNINSVQAEMQRAPAEQQQVLMDELRKLLNIRFDPKLNNLLTDEEKQQLSLEK